ncbi:helix-turn-helix domain-containing protein [Chitinophaga pinensis]|uniref:ImmA/IrrE family metallo-endopeptidase n=1 Tax=Chitinophaga pinensis TaxID=79329 RepID=A0A5C6LVK1_9BACT|nr:XRE family transcriptional regulator [Chitinophaga pinensis]TWW00657.1 ImmA/IrrE family metallo-endopeptidase [Chitinophaga pinensis]
MQYFGERLKAARKIKGWSLQDLANQTANSITKQALSKYEADVMHPSRKILLLLSAALGVKPGYFEGQPAFRLPDFEFPRKGNVPSKQIDSIKEKVKGVLERYLQAESLLNMPVRFSHPLKTFPVADETAAAAIAVRLLDKWDLGKGPVHNITGMLEERSIRVIEVDAPVTFDALGTWIDKVPLIVLHQDRQADIKRYYALYELGQLLLTVPETADKDRICQTFAAAMLLPGDTLESLLGAKRTAIAPGELICIKEQYGLPMQVIMKHAIFKDIIDRKETGAFFRMIMDNKDEIGLGCYTGQEKTGRFDRMVRRLMAEEVIPAQKAEALTGIPEEALKKQLEVFAVLS